MQKTSRMQISCTQSLLVITYNHITNYEIKAKKRKEKKRKSKSSKKKNQKAFRHRENAETLQEMQK